jgi:hypothetical protein
MVGDGRAHLVGHVTHGVLPYQHLLLEPHDGVLQLSWDGRVSLMGGSFISREINPGAASPELLVVCNASGVKTYAVAAADAITTATETHIEPMTLLMVEELLIIIMTASELLLLLLM